MTKCALTPLLLTPLLLLGCMAYGLWQAPQRINHDCAGLMHQAEMMLDGAMLYRDSADISPPLITYISVVPVALGRALGQSPIVTYNALIAALTLLSSVEIYVLLMGFAWRMNRGRPAGGRKKGQTGRVVGSFSKQMSISLRRLRVAPAARGLVLLSWVALFFVFDIRSDAGQREHLLVLLYVPYLFLRILRHRGGEVSGWFALLLGVQAGIGVSLKPHFLLAALCVELALFLATKRLRAIPRIENFAMAAVIFAYVIHWFFVPAEMRDAYFHRWLPLAVRGYGAYNMSYGDIWRGVYTAPIALTALASTLVAIMMASRRRSRLRLHLLAFAVLAAGGLLIVFLQHKGFTYHRILFESAGLLCLAVMASTAERRVAGRSVLLPSRTASLFMLAIGLLVTAWFIERSFVHPDPPEYVALQRILQRRSQPGDRVLILATSVRPAYPMLLRLGRKQGSRYGCAMHLALLYAGAAPPGDGRPIYRRGDEAPAEERQFLRELGDDVAQLQPRLVIINDQPGWQGLPDGFNVHEYLVYTGWTKDALRPYHELPGPKGWRVFER